LRTSRSPHRSECEPLRLPPSPVHSSLSGSAFVSVRSALDLRSQTLRLRFRLNCCFIPSSPCGIREGPRKYSAYRQTPKDVRLCRWPPEGDGRVIRSPPFPRLSPVYLMDPTRPRMLKMSKNWRPGMLGDTDLPLI
jgi:hypothetical protein